MEQKPKRKFLKHGEGLRVPMIMMDDLQRSVAASLVDAFGQRAGLRPGYVFDTSEDQAARAAGYADYKQQLGDAWRDGAGAGQAVVHETIDDEADAYEGYCQYLANAWRPKR